MRILSWLITLPILLVAGSFVFANRGTVTVSFWPTEVELIVPLYLVMLGALALGLVLGAVVTWLSTLRFRFEARRLRQQLVAEKAAAAEQIKQIKQALQPDANPPRRNWIKAIMGGRDKQSRQI